MIHSPMCSIIILSYNQLEYTIQCLDSIEVYTKDADYEIIVIDNASDRETVEYLEHRKDITLIKNGENKGFAGGCNQGISMAQGQYIMLLNNDTIVTDKWLFHMLEFLEEHQDVSMTGPLTNATVGKQMIEVLYGENMESMQRFAKDIAASNEKPWRTLRLVAFCLLIRRSLFDEIGLLDTRFALGNYEDDDFNLRALCAEKTAYISRNSFVHHFMNISFQQRDIHREQVMLENKIRMEDKWDNLSWNHHAVFNQYMLDRIQEQKGKEILHLGCGLGALTVELKDADAAYHVTGTETHPLRREIASYILDELLDSDFTEKISQQLYEKFDVVIIEGMLEVFGLELMQKIRTVLKKDGLILLRVFNIRHITTLERLITGKVGGRLLCASSKEFRYYFDKSLEEKLSEMNYKVMGEKKVVKSFSNIQKEICQEVQKHLAEGDEMQIYNRIYCLKLQ